MSIEFTCPHCNKLLEAGDHLAGKDAECPACKKKVTVPDKKKE
jgi:phage FluMu protein Com